MNQSSITLKPPYIKVHPLLPVSVVSLWFHAGSRHAPEDLDGLPHLLEHLILSKNTKVGIPNPDTYGFIYNGYTSNDLVNFHCVCTPGDEIKAVQFLLTAFTNTSFSASKIEKEKSIILDEETRNRNSPFRYIHRIANQGVWPKSDLSKDVYGNAKTIRKIKLRDINHFYRSQYRNLPGTPIIITPKKIKLDQFFYYPNGQKKFVLKKKRLAKVNKMVRLPLPNKQSVLAISYRVDNTSLEEKIALHFLTTHLADGWSSQLNVLLRQLKNQTYWVNGKTYFSYDTGYIRFCFSTKKELVDNVLNDAFLSLEETLIDNLSEAKIHSTCQYLKTKLLMHRSNIYSQLHHYGKLILSNDKANFLSFEAYVHKLINIDPKIIRAVSEKYLKEFNRSVAIIG